MNRFLLLCLLLFSFNASCAYYPSMKLDFENIKMKRSEREKLQAELLEFLVENPAVLKTQGRRFKEDQYCRYQMDTDPEAKTIQLETIKVLDDKKNLSYNLKIIEFLRLKKDLQLKKRNEEKPIKIAFKYLAF